MELTIEGCRINTVCLSDIGVGNFFVTADDVLGIVINSSELKDEMIECWFFKYKMTEHIERDAAVYRLKKVKIEYE